MRRGVRRGGLGAARRGSRSSRVAEAGRVRHEYVMTEMCHTVRRGGGERGRSPVLSRCGRAKIFDAAQHFALDARKTIEKISKKLDETNALTGVNTTHNFTPANNNNERPTARARSRQQQQQQQRRRQQHARSRRHKDETNETATTTTTGQRSGATERIVGSVNSRVKAQAEASRSGSGNQVQDPARTHATNHLGCGHHVCPPRFTARRAWSLETQCGKVSGFGCR